MQSEGLLAELDARRVRTRARASAGWLPLLLTGLALLGAFPAYAGWWDGPPSECACALRASDPSLRDRLTANIGSLAGSRPLALYWLAVVPAVYLLSVLWFASAARRSGFRQRWGLYTVIGLGTLLVLLLTLLPPLDGWVPHSSRPLLTPLLALAFGLLALGRVEHERVLLTAGAAVSALAVVVAALSHYVSGLSDSFFGNVGQALLAPSVEVATMGLVLVVAALLLRSAQGRLARSPVMTLSPELP
ncbi:MAG: hypothetical protein JWP11_1735 [Frankiales bacterium]|nr:hypothetical protein [Frankiales bacterium]